MSIEFERPGGGGGGQRYSTNKEGEAPTSYLLYSILTKKGTPFVHRFLDKNRYPFHLSRTLHPFYKPLMKLMNNITGEHAW